IRSSWYSYPRTPGLEWIPLALCGNGPPGLPFCQTVPYRPLSSRQFSVLTWGFTVDPTPPEPPCFPSSFSRRAGGGDPLPAAEGTTVVTFGFGGGGGGVGRGGRLAALTVASYLGGSSSIAGTGILHQPDGSILLKGLFIA